MKKWIAVFFVLQFASNQTFARELARFPVLFIHYLEHKAKESHHHHTHDRDAGHHHTQGFGDFVADHYGDDTNDSEHNHGHLPFKSSDCCSVMTITLMLCSTVESLPLSAHEEKFTRNFVFNQTLKSQFHQHIWQPPKIS